MPQDLNCNIVMKEKFKINVSHPLLLQTTGLQPSSIENF